MNINSDQSTLYFSFRLNIVLSSQEWFIARDYDLTSVSGRTYVVNYMQERFMHFLSSKICYQKRATVKTYFTLDSDMIYISKWHKNDA